MMSRSDWRLPVLGRTAPRGVSNSPRQNASTVLLVPPNGRPRAPALCPHPPALGVTGADAASPHDHMAAQRLRSSLAGLGETDAEIAAREAAPSTRWGKQKLLRP